MTGRDTTQHQTNGASPSTNDPDALRQWLEANIPRFASPFTLERIAGGQSNPTYLIHAQSGRYVLRSKPVGNLLTSAHAVDREFLVLSALARSQVPVPKVYALCENTSVFESMFYVMEHVEGRIFSDPRLPSMTNSDRNAIFRSMNATIADIHSLDPVAIGLGDFGHWNHHLERQVNRWATQYRASATVPNPAIEKLVPWLVDHMPPEGETRLVHGDYRRDNLVIHQEEPAVVSVLDWELATLGNPIADFAYHVMIWRFAPELFRGLACTDLQKLGIPDEADYVRAYFERTGFNYPSDWNYYIILGMFRVSAILQGITKRSQDGTASDPRASTVGEKSRPISELAWHLAQQSKRM